MVPTGGSSLILTVSCLVVVPGTAWACRFCISSLDGKAFVVKPILGPERFWDIFEPLK